MGHETIKRDRKADQIIMLYKIIFICIFSNKTQKKHTLVVQVIYICGIQQMLLSKATSKITLVMSMVNYSSTHNCQDSHCWQTAIIARLRCYTVLSIIFKSQEVQTYKFFQVITYRHMEPMTRGHTQTLLHLRGSQGWEPLAQHVQQRKYTHMNILPYIQSIIFTSICHS